MTCRKPVRTRGTEWSEPNRYGSMGLPTEGAEHPVRGVEGVGGGWHPPIWAFFAATGTCRADFDPYLVAIAPP